MDSLEFIAQLISALAWPITTAVLAFLFVRAARSTGLLGDLRARIQTLKAGPGGVEASFFEYGTSAIDVGIPTRSHRQQAISSSPAVVPSVLRERAANLYWLGHDLPWTIDVVLRGADRPIVLFGIRQALHHLKAVGMGESVAAQWLSTMLETLGKQTSALEPEQRAQIAQNLRAVVELIGDHVIAQQPDFDPGPRVLGGIDLPSTSVGKHDT